MKKLVLAMACVLSLALLASCKQAASTQDVNLKNQEKAESYAWKGAVTLTADAVSGTTAYTSTAAADGFTVGPQFAEIKWSEGADTLDSNYKDFALTFYADYNNNTAATNYNPSWALVTLNFSKIADKYYVQYTAPSTIGSTTVVKAVTVDGDPLSGEFTISTDTWYETIDTQTANITKVVFKKAE